MQPIPLLKTNLLFTYIWWRQMFKYLIVFPWAFDVSLSVKAFVPRINLAHFDENNSTNNFGRLRQVRCCLHSIGRITVNIIAALIHQVWIRRRVDTWKRQFSFCCLWNVDDIIDLWAWSVQLMIGFSRHSRRTRLCRYRCVCVFLFLRGCESVLLFWDRAIQVEFQDWVESKRSSLFFFSYSAFWYIITFLKLINRI